LVQVQLRIRDKPDDVKGQSSEILIPFFDIYVQAYA
jgi:hypothetical protein